MCSGPRARSGDTFSLPFRISYCTADKMHDKVFAYIAQSQHNQSLECHAFLCTKRKMVSGEGWGWGRLQRPWQPCCGWGAVWCGRQDPKVTITEEEGEIPGNPKWVLRAKWYNGEAAGRQMTRRSAWCGQWLARVPSVWAPFSL